MSLSDDADSVQNLRDRIDEVETARERCEFQLRIEEVKKQIRSTVAGIVSGERQRCRRLPSTPEYAHPLGRFIHLSL